VLFRFQDMEDPNLHILHSLLWRVRERDDRCPQDHLHLFRRQGEWVEGEGVFQAPAGATAAEVRLYLRYSAKGTVWLNAVELTPAEPPSRRQLRVAVCQGDLPQPSCEWAAHVEHWAPLVSEAAAACADLLLLPEFRNACGHPEDATLLAEPIPGGPVYEQLRRWAAEHGMWLAARLLESAGEMVYNACVLLDREGSLTGKYRKTHPYWPEERLGVTSGSELPVFATEFGAVGIMICYDSWWPETARLLALKGAELLLFPNAGGTLNGAPGGRLPSRISSSTAPYREIATEFEHWESEGGLERR